MRRLKYPDAADVLDAAVASVKPKSKRRHPTPREIIAHATPAMEEMRRTGNWTEAKGKHLVALYVWLHTEIYHVEPAELFTEETMLAAIGAADRLVKGEFGGDAKRCVEFMAWSWARVKRSTTAGRDTDWRLTWRAQFGSKAMLTDYRVDVVRGHAR
ncbi:MAG TPA: hypothetical protein PKI27_00810 [Dermatophilaceae bacterium]|jgi:hypothetical protein|nr:hypothetical protein [Dermatophilaceae bacterium]